MRQWGSSLNHNGMSFFLATVPAGTQLYHGSSSSQIIEGMEWLAFEPEHALLFAHPKPHPRQDMETIFKQPGEKHSLQRLYAQRPFEIHATGDLAEIGYLHTYRPKHALRLLYIDGMSAGKTLNGTLDTQDMLIRNLSATEPGRPLRGDYERAQDMCDLTTSLWQGKIDGFLRMEGGFEIILCEFTQHVDRSEIIAITPHSGPNGGRGFVGGWSYIKAVTRQYQGIAGERVRLNYNDFISVFAYANIGGLFDNDVQSDEPQPRLSKVSVADRLLVQRDVTNMILRQDRDETNWQAIADVVVSQYSRPLHFLHNNEQIRSETKALQYYLTTLLLPFIDYTARNTTLEKQRCITQLVPASPVDNLAHESIVSITDLICSTLLKMLSIVSEPTPGMVANMVSASNVTRLLDDLVEHLRWPTWKECGACADEEVCYVPIWPWGNHADHKHPSCLKEQEVFTRSGYWGNVGR